MLFQNFLNYFIIKDITVLVDIFQHKNIQSGVIYHCYNAKTALQVHKIFNENNLIISNKRVESKNPITPHVHAKIGVVLNTSCEGWTNVFNSVDDNFTKNSLMWLLMTENLTETIIIVSQYKIELDSDVIIIFKHDNAFILYEVYHIGFNRNAQFIVSEVGQWNGSLHTEAKDRKDLKGLVLRSIVVIPEIQKVVNRTFLRYLEEEQPDLIKVDPMHKFKGYAALKYFQDMFNITYDFQRTTSWGYPSNGTFDGLVGSLQRGEADIGGSPLFIRADRMDALDYAAETWLTKPTFIFRHPKHPGGYLTIYTRPLTGRVWWCVISLMALSAAVLTALLSLTMVKAPGDDESLSLVLLFVWSAICQQGMEIRQSANSVKMVIFTTFLFTLTLYQYYNATVVSTLLREQPKNIKTLKDLTQSNLKAGIEDILYNKDYFGHTTDPLAREIYLKKVVHTTPHKYFSPEQGMAMVKKGMFAFHVDSAVAYRIIRHSFTEKELCELQEVSVFGSYLGLAVAKRSPYREIMAYGTRKLSECGVMSRLRSAWDESRPACVRTPDASLISVSLPEFSAALAALALGTAAALILLAAEILSEKFRKEHQIPFRH